MVERAVEYLLDKCYPLNCTENEKRSIRRKAKQLVIRNGEVYYLKFKKESSGEKVMVAKYI